MIQGISGKCPQCGQTDIIVTRIDGMNYEGYCAACENPVFGFFVLTHESEEETKDE